MKKTSGIENLPRILKKPFYTDRFFWIMLGTAIFWGMVIWWVIF